MHIKCLCVPYTLAWLCADMSLCVVCYLSCRSGVRLAACLCVLSCSNCWHQAVAPQPSCGNCMLVLSAPLSLLWLSVSWR